MPGTLIAGQLTIPISCVVRQDPKLWFSTPRVRKETRQITLHYTGGTRPPEKMFETVRSRGLSVHLAVAHDGTVWQFADLERRCAHAGLVDDSNHDGHEYSANEHSIGIEVVCPGHALPKKQRKSAEIVVNDARWQVLREEIHGLEMRQATYTQAQTVAVLELVQALCGHYGLPVAVPMEVDGHVLARTMTEEEFRAFRGVVPHYGLKSGKRDPGLAIMRAVAALPLRGKDGAAE